MKILIRGAGWYGCHLARALRQTRHHVTLTDRRGRMFGGASGSNPARLHLGYHYPRSGATRESCARNNAAFLDLYGALARPVPVNHYAIAENDSLLDFRTYCAVLNGEAPFELVPDLAAFGYRCLEGAIATPEKHLVIREVREYFERELYDVWVSGSSRDQPRDVTIDCTFCAGSSAGIARYEPCVMGLLEGPIDRALTVMDGPFPSVYPWDEEEHLSSITSASLTPMAKCATYEEAQFLLDHTSYAGTMDRAEHMVEQMARFWPEVRERYKLVMVRTGIRAQPASAADARFCAIERSTGEFGEVLLTVRPGKIDSVMHAEREVRALLEELPCFA